jgi:gluconolactonase
MVNIKEFSTKAKSIFYETAELEKICTGYFFTEGPVWNGKTETLYFTDFPRNAIHRWTQAEGASVFTADSNRVIGMSMDRAGRLVGAQSKPHAISYIYGDDSEIIVDSFGGKQLNSPNDVVVAKPGDIFFTDPYSTAMAGPRELPYSGVFRVVPGQSEPILIDDCIGWPNGLALSPDESIFYVNDTSAQNIIAYQLNADRSTSRIGVFATLDTSHGNGSPDGMKVDIEGNVYLTGPGGIWVLDKSGAPIAILLMPEHIGNLCFGMEDNSSLIITASASVYTLKVKIPGVVPVLD